MNRHGKKNDNMPRSSVLIKSSSDIDIFKSALKSRANELKNGANAHMAEPYEDIIESCENAKDAIDSSPVLIKLSAGAIDIAVSALEAYRRAHGDSAAGELELDIIRHIRGPHSLNPSQRPVAYADI